MNRQTILHIFLLPLSALFFAGCFNTRFLEKDERLFIKNEVELITAKKERDRSLLKREILDLSKLQPNQKLLGLTKTRLWFYNVSNRPKEKRFTNWMKTKVGEPPIFYDSTLAMKSVFMMENYLLNKGFFYPEVSYEVDLSKPKKAKLIYNIKAGERFHYGKIYFPHDSTSRVAPLVRTKIDDSKLVSGQPFDVADLKSERDRITEDLRNEGYYLFTRENVYYDIDTGRIPNEMDIYVNINTPSDSVDHRKFYINNIYIYTDFRFEQMKNPDTNFDTLTRGYYFFIYKQLQFKPYTLLRGVLFRKSDLYSRSEVQRTIYNLTDLGVFKFINVAFEPLKSDSLNLLDCHIKLTPAKKQEMSATFEANNNTYNLLGVMITLSYINKNIFRGAERFQFDISTGTETNFTYDPFFNTIDLNATASLLFNKFLIPFRIRNLSKNALPKTRVSLRYSLLRRVNNFSIITFNTSYGYEWRRSMHSRHIFNLLNISLVRAPKDRQSEEFLTLLETSPSLRNSFSEQLIIGMSHSYYWARKHSLKAQHQYSFRLNNEMAGNFINGISAIENIFNKNTDRPFSLFGITYAQFYRVEGDFRYYYNMKKVSRIATRSFFGLGIPFGNSSVMPYIKQYFGGGSMSMRGWRVRTLGPGSFNYRKSPDYTGGFVDQTGDIKLELNAELRFDIIKFIKGAVFVDAGNVWLMREDSTRPGANFEMNRFYKEISLASGFGTRFDLSYFVLRFDVGFKLFDPTEDHGERWVVKNINFNEKGWLRNYFTLNLALGYPF